MYSLTVLTIVLKSRSEVVLFKFIGNYVQYETKYQGGYVTHNGGSGAHPYANENNDIEICPKYLPLW